MLHLERVPESTFSIDGFNQQSTCESHTRQNLSVIKGQTPSVGRAGCGTG